MRTIKFRGKRKDNEKWVYGDLFSIRTKEGNVGFFIVVKNTAIADKSVPVNSICFEHGVDCFCVKENTIGQFTGLQDSKGQDIYEGDIIDIGDNECSLVVYDESSAQYDLNQNGLLIQESVIYEGFVVIGNIHDNPELLKGGEK